MGKASADAAALLATALDAARRGERAQAITLLERAHALDTKHVGIRNALGVLRLEAGDTTGALVMLKPLARELPQAGPIQLNYGNALVAAGRAADAVAPLKRAASLDAQNAITWYGYGRALQIAGRVAEAHDAYARTLAIDPSHVNARANLVAVLNFLDRYEEAEAQARRVLQGAPQDAGAHLNLAVTLLAQGRWAEGWAEYEWRGRTALLDGQRRTWSAPEWQGDDPAGRTVLVHAEQGFGDTLQWARYLPVLRARGARVLLQCPATLVSLLEASSLADVVLPFGETPPAHDVQLALTSLPHRLALHDHAAVMGDGAPYLQVPAALREETYSWQQAAAPRIGLVWQGSATHVNDMHRSCGFAAMTPLFGARDVTWVSLQAPAAGVPPVKPPKGTRWIDHGGALADFAHTAAALCSLDGVVTVDSAVAHLAGALGVRCWLLLPRIGLDWRWAAETPQARWYASVRPVRQDAPGSWRAAMERIRGEVERGV